MWLQYPDLDIEEATHTYRWRGVVCMGVTSLFDRVGVRKDSEKPFMPLGIPDYCKSEEASGWGKAFHKIAEMVLKGQNPHIADEDKKVEAQFYIDTFRKFLRLKPLHLLYDENGTTLIEYPVYSQSLKLAGTFDFLGLDKNNRIVLPDWKTSGQYVKTYGPQTAAYEAIAREVFKGRQLFTESDEVIFIDQRTKIYRSTVMFNDKFKEGYEVKEGEKQDFNNFLSILNTYRMAA